MDLEGLHDSGWVCDINSQERQKRVECCGDRLSSIILASSSDYWPGGLKGGVHFSEVRVTDAHPGRDVLVTNAEGKDEDGSDRESGQDGATKIKFLRSFLIKDS